VVLLVQRQVCNLLKIHNKYRLTLAKVYQGICASRKVTLQPLVKTSTLPMEITTISTPVSSSISKMLRRRLVDINTMSRYAEYLHAHNLERYPNPSKAVTQHFAHHYNHSKSTNPYFYFFPPSAPLTIGAIYFIPGFMSNGTIGFGGVVSILF